jgi:hypothetical protein
VQFANTKRECTALIVMLLMTLLYTFEWFSRSSALAGGADDTRSGVDSRQGKTYNPPNLATGKKTTTYDTGDSSGST